MTSSPKETLSLNRNVKNDPIQKTLFSMDDVFQGNELFTWEEYRCPRLVPTTTLFFLEAQEGQVAES